MRRLALLALVALAGAGCGASRHASAPPAPKLPRALAHRLAGESDAVAAALARGDACAAKRLAGRLRRDASATIGRVPAALQEPLSSGVNAVGESLPACAHATPTTTAVSVTTAPAATTTATTTTAATTTGATTATATVTTAPATTAIATTPTQTLPVPGPPPGHGKGHDKGHGHGGKHGKGG